MSPSIFRSSLRLFRKDHGAQNPENSKRKKDGSQHDGATALSTVMTTPSISVRERSLTVQDVSHPNQTSDIITQVESQSTEQVLSPMAQATTTIPQPATTVSTSSPSAPTTPAASCADSATSDTVPSDTSSIVQRLWDRAYDDLKADESALVLAYEKILSRELNKKAPKSGELEFQTNTIE
jgi:N-terminal domain of NWD NACHT-NTPase